MNPSPESERSPEGSPTSRRNGPSSGRIGVLNRVLGRIARRALRFSYRHATKGRTSLDTAARIDFSERRTFKRAIVVTAHSKRFESSAAALIRTLAENTELPIFVVINGDFPESGFQTNVRCTFLAQITQFPTVNPVCIGTGRGMSFLWNTGIRMTAADQILVLSDDLGIDQTSVGGFINACFTALDRSDLVIANGSFGHFALRRSLIDEVGWFDELLLGFGEEDGDFVWRCQANPTIRIQEIFHPGLYNLGAETGFEDVVKGTGKYSLFNRVVMFSALYAPDPDGIRGMFSHPHRRKITIPDYYPGDAGWRALQGLVSEESEGEIKCRVDRWLSSDVGLPADDKSAGAL